MPNLLEICCDHLSSALAAQAGGAGRIELCTALSTDGLSPSAGLLATVRKHLTIPVFVLIRPRPGNFVYSAEELELMLTDIHQCKSLGAAGIVSGALQSDGTIDEAATAQLIAAARPLPFTFHKAFDLTPDPLTALQQLIVLGADRVLTSGQAATAIEGQEVLRCLVEEAAGRITILCAGGVRDHNIADLRRINGLHEFHSAALNKGQGSGQSYPVVDREMVRKMHEFLV